MRQSNIRTEGTGMAHICDPYCTALEKAKERVEKLPHPDGLADWLRANHPNLYREFFVDTPCLIEKLWGEKVPLGEFNDVLDRWVDVHAQATKLYERREAAGRGIGE